MGSVASTIMYAFYVDETIKSKQLCTVPVINMKRADLDTFAHVRWLLDSCHIDLSTLIFIDEVLFHFTIPKLETSSFLVFVDILILTGFNNLNSSIVLYDIEQIDLAYYDLFGSLKLVLVNCDKIPSEQEVRFFIPSFWFCYQLHQMTIFSCLLEQALREAIVEVFHCSKV